MTRFVLLRSNFQGQCNSGFALPLSRKRDRRFFGFALFFPRALRWRMRSPSATMSWPCYPKPDVTPAACHGNASGKAGFKLSLRGQDPELDFYALTRDQFGRRVDPVEPDQQLDPARNRRPKSFTKAESGFPRILRNTRRSVDGLRPRLPNDVLTAPKLKKIEVTPAEQMLVGPGGPRSNCGCARRSPTVRNVTFTPMAVYEPGQWPGKSCSRRTGSPRRFR